MLRYKTDFMRHSYTLQQILLKRDGVATIDAGTMVVRARFGNRDIVLHPQFVIRRPDGKMQYAPRLLDSTVGFLGWLPYNFKAWPIGDDKLTFKDYVSKQGLRTARWEFNPDNVDFDFIVKATRSAFGYGIRGPCSPRDLDDPETKLKEGDYYEQLIFGKIVKAWYWNDKLAAIELFDMPRVKGDGRHTFAELVQHAIGKDVDAPGPLGKIARLQGFGVNDVLAENREVLGDYRYVSPLNPTVYRNFNVRESIKGTEIGARFEQAGAGF